MKYQFKSTLIKDENSSLMWYWHFQVPDEYVVQLNKPNKRVICSINDATPYHCALTSKGNGSYFIMVNKDRRKSLALEAGDILNVTLEKDNSTYGIEVPEVFTELCYQDPEGKNIFHSLTIGKQRSLLHLIGKPKSEQKQLEKVLIVFDYLKSVNGKLDFKELNEAFKNNRFKI